MSSKEYNITIEQGADFYRDLVIKDSTGAVVNITTATFVGKLRKLVDDSNAAASFTFTKTDATNGKVRVSLTPEVIATLPLEKSDKATRKDTAFSYDWKMTLSGTTTRLAFGVASVSPEASK